MNSQTIKVIVVDDHAMVRKGLKILLDGFEEICVIGEAGNGLGAIDLVEQLQPDVVLMDLDMPIMDGIEAIRRIIAIRPEQRIIVLTGYIEDEKLLKAVQAGALGYVGKTIDTKELIQSIRNVHEGQPALDPAAVWQTLREFGYAKPARESGSFLTERELEVLHLLAQGKTDQEIARELVLAEVTIRTHVSRILVKLQVKNRVQAALCGIRLGLVSIDDFDMDDRFDRRPYTP